MIDLASYLSGSRVSSQSDWCLCGTAVSMCRIGCGEPCFVLRFSVRSSHIRLHLLPDRACLHAREGTDLVRKGRSRLVRFWVGLNHLIPSTSSERNSVFSVHMRCSRTASLRETATTARRRPANASISGSSFRFAKSLKSPAGSRFKLPIGKNRIF